MTHEIPLFHRLENQPVLVVGGGAVAVRKVEALLPSGARLIVVAPRLHETLATWCAQQRIAVLERPFCEADVIGQRLVIAATDDDAVNADVARAARAQGVLVNVVDTPALCDVIFPAHIDRAPLHIAISTGGASPVLARLLRAKLESVIPAAWGQVAEFAKAFRATVKQALSDSAQRRRFWEMVLQGPIAEQILNGRVTDATTALHTLLHQFQSGAAPTPGEVYLIGTGPGDPDLLTFRALRLMQQADVALYDNLVSPGVLALVRRDAEKIYVGKRRKQHSLPQTAINQLLAELASQGRRVARLKGGDPFIFGRGGEEIETLMEQGIPFQVVPGITAALGCASYAGIPLTHRDYAQACLFVTGHRRDDEALELNWSQLALPQQTVVVYMGSTQLVHLCERLIAHGAPPDRPAAIVERGTLQQQRVITATLADLPQRAEAVPLSPPTLLIIGDVVRLHPRLRWFGEDSSSMVSNT